MSPSNAIFLTEDSLSDVVLFVKIPQELTRLERESFLKNSVLILVL